MRVCVWDEFSEYLLENWVPTSADFNTYPIRILDTHIWRFFLSIKKICSFGILRCHGGDLVEFQMCHQSPWYIIVTTPFYSGLKWSQFLKKIKISWKCPPKILNNFIIYHSFRAFRVILMHFVLIEQLSGFCTILIFLDHCDSMS